MAQKKALYLATSLEKLNELCDIDKKFVDNRKLEAIKESCELLLKSAKESEREDEECAYRNYMRAANLFMLMRKRQDYDARYYDAMLGDQISNALKRAHLISEILAVRYAKLNGGEQTKPANASQKQPEAQVTTKTSEVEKQEPRKKGINDYYKRSEEKTDDSLTTLSYSEMCDKLNNLSSFRLSAPDTETKTGVLSEKEPNKLANSVSSENTRTVNAVAPLEDLGIGKIETGDHSAKTPLYPQVTPLSSVFGNTSRQPLQPQPQPQPQSQPQPVSRVDTKDEAANGQNRAIPIIDRSTKPRANAAKVDDPDKKRSVGAASGPGLKRSNSLPQLADENVNIPLKPIAPAYDRSTKPTNGSINGHSSELKSDQPAAIASIPPIDRSLKPVVNDTNPQIVQPVAAEKTDAANTPSKPAPVLSTVPATNSSVQPPQPTLSTQTVAAVNRNMSTATLQDSATRPSSVTSQTNPVEQQKVPRIDRSTKPTAQSAATAPAPVIQRFDVTKLVATLTRAQLIDLEPRAGRVKPGLTGLYNMHNTCFFNSAIQVLSHTPSIVEFFAEEGHIQPQVLSRSPLINEWVVLLKALWCGNFLAVRPAAFARAVQKRLPDLIGPALCDTAQQDAQEFLMEFLSVMHDELNEAGSKPSALNSIYEFDEQTALRVDLYSLAEEFWKNHLMQNRSIVVSLFQGLLLNTIVCSGCRMRSFKFEPFQFLSVPLPQRGGPIRIDACFREFLLEEVIEDRRCDRCGRRCAASKKLDIIRAPNVLIVHLKRFQVDMTGRRAQKRADWVVYPPEMNLTGHMHPAIRSQIKQQYTAYTLYGVVNHTGTLTSGHYTANVMHAALDKWHYFDDERVSASSVEQSITPAAYILFYAKAPLIALAKARQ